MKSWIAWLLVAVALVGGGVGGFWLGHREPPGKIEESSTDVGKSEDKPLASVTVMPLHRGLIAEQLTVYGWVMSPLGEVQMVSVPFECRVTHLLVSAGQAVKTGDILVELQGSTATALAAEEAQNAVAAAERDLQLVKQRYDEKLATNTDLYAAENANRAAQAKLQSLQQSGVSGVRQLKAEMPGIVSKLDVQLGQVVPAGGPLVEVAASRKLEVKLGIEPGDTRYLHVGQSLELSSILDPSGSIVEGKITLISQRVDPTSRLVDVMVNLPENSQLLLDSSVLGHIDKTSTSAFVVPRDAILPSDNGGNTLFTIKDDKAVKHAVKLGIETDRAAQVIADDLKEGDLVVVSGNYVLEDGMSVHATPAASVVTPSSGSPTPTTVPTTQPADAASLSQFSGPVSAARFSSAEDGK